jgi:hypothetical protein
MNLESVNHQRRYIVIVGYKKYVFNIVHLVSTINGKR